MSHSERIAVIDCGTNTFNLLIAEVNGHAWQTIFTTKIPVKLGVGGFSKGIIRPERMARAVDALRSHNNTILNFGVSKKLCFATSALREAENGNELVKQAKELFGIDIRIIDGAKEAELIYHGVKQSINFGADRWTIMDIGGGSTEFIICNAEQVFWKASFPLGVSRIFEQLAPADPILPQQIDQLNSFLKTALQPLAQALVKFPSQRLMGSSGSFDSILSLLEQRKPEKYNRQGQDNAKIEMQDFKELHNELLLSTKEERLKMRGLEPIRAEYIVLATLLITYVLNELNFTELWQSEFALKEGAIYEVIHS